MATPKAEHANTQSLPSLPIGGAPVNAFIWGSWGYLEQKGHGSKPGASPRKGMIGRECWVIHSQLMAQ